MSRLLLLLFLIIVVVSIFTHVKILEPFSPLPLWMPTTFRRSRYYDVAHPCLKGHKHLFPWVESTLDPVKPIHYHKNKHSQVYIIEPPGDIHPEIHAPKRLYTS